MVKLSEIRALIDAYIKTNGNQQITGHTMNVVLNEIVRILDERKQDVLVSGENIKTIGGMSLLGEGDIPGYDDTEIRNLINAVVTAVEGQNGKIAEVAESVQEQGKKLTELSEENERLKERIEEQDLFIEDLQNTKIDREADDYYPKLAVGLADNLAGVDVVDSEIHFRRSGGGAITDGVARIEAIKGNSVVWNQKIDTTKYVSKTQNGVTFTKNADGSISVSTDANGATADTNINIVVQGAFKDHYLFMDGCPSGGSTSSYYIHDIWSGRNDIGSGILWKSSENTADIRIVVKAGTIITSSLVFRPRFCDVTQAFQHNTPTTIEEFYKRIPMGVDLNAYNEGEVINMDVQSIESQGVNAWDEEWELGTFNNNGEEVTTGLNDTIRCDNPIEILPNTEYCFTIPNVASGSYMGFAFFYDSEGEYIKKIPIAGSAYPTVKTPANAHTMRFDIRREYGTTYKGDICINLSDTSVNGKYYPYIKRVEDLSIIRKYFPDGMKSAGTAHDEIRFNKATKKWEYSKGKIKSVDLGSLTWDYYSSSNTSLFKAQFADIKIGTSNDVANMLCAPYTANNANTWQGDKTIVVTPFSGIQVWIHDEAYKDNLEAFKAAMQGVILYYEPNEWEWVELDAEDQFKDLDYQVWNAGTEKAIAEGKSAPLAADITYGFNAIGKIKELESLVAALRAKVGI